MRWPRFAIAVLAVACGSNKEEPASQPPEAGATPAPVSAAVAAAPPPVLAASTGAPARTAAETGDRIYSKGRFVWIQPQPGARGWIGYLTLGDSVRLFEGDRQKALTKGPGCEAWYRVEPQGFVCLGPETTLDPNDPVYRALADHAGRPSAPSPFEYGESVGAPRYFSLPSPSYQRAMEVDLDKHLTRIHAIREPFREGRTAAIDPTYAGIDPLPAGVPFPELPVIPNLVHENRDRVIRGSTVAWSRSYDDPSGRTFLYTSDHALVPKDRVKPYPKSTFQGVHLDETTRLPIAFFRKKDRPRFTRDGEGRFHEADGVFSRLSYVMLTGREETSEGSTYLETRTEGVWVLAADAAVARVQATIPYVGEERERGRRTWLDVSVLGGTLVAYEGERPVFATLISPGRGGIPFPGRDPVSTASTPIGNFRVDGKFRWATMVSSSDSNIVHAEVQWVQNFHGPHALHGAYWHDAWGEQKSGGCINLSPIDSKWLFNWTEPRLPTDWHGIRSVAALGPATRVIVRR